MERNGVKGIMLLLLLLCPILVGAPPGGLSCFYYNPYGCEGIAWCCGNLQQNQCCNVEYNQELYGWAVNVHSGKKHGTVVIYENDDCWHDHGHKGYRGTDYACMKGNCLVRFYSSQWWPTDSLGGNPPNPPFAPQTVRNEPCNGSMYTDILMYTFITEEGRRASWVLPKVNISEVDFDPRKLTAYKQVEWFKSHGATLEADDGEFISSNVTGLPDPHIEPPPGPPPHC